MSTIFFLINILGKIYGTDVLLNTTAATEDKKKPQRMLTSFDSLGIEHLERIALFCSNPTDLHHFKCANSQTNKAAVKVLSSKKVNMTDFLFDSEYVKKQFSGSLRDLKHLSILPDYRIDRDKSDGRWIQDLPQSIESLELEIRYIPRDDSEGQNPNELDKRKLYLLLDGLISRTQLKKLKLTLIVSDAGSKDPTLTDKLSRLHCLKSLALGSCYTDYSPCTQRILSKMDNLASIESLDLLDYKFFAEEWDQSKVASKGAELADLINHEKMPSLRELSLSFYHYYDRNQENGEVLAFKLGNEILSEMVGKLQKLEAITVRHIDCDAAVDLYAYGSFSSDLDWIERRITTIVNALQELKHLKHLRFEKCDLWLGAPLLAEELKDLRDESELPELTSLDFHKCRIGKCLEDFASNLGGLKAMLTDESKKGIEEGLRYQAWDACVKDHPSYGWLDNIYEWSKEEFQE